MKLVPGHRVAADPDAGRLPDPLLGQLVQRLVGEGARPADDARPARRAGRCRPEVMPMLHLPGRDDARAVGAEQPGAGVVALQPVEEERLVLGRDALGDADDEADARRGRLQDGRGRALGRHDDERGVGPGGRHGLGHGVVDGDALDVGAALAGRDPGHHLGAVVAVAQAVEAALAPGQALDDHLGVLVDEDAHRSPPASATARRAASSMVSSTTSRSDRCWRQDLAARLGVGAVEAQHDRRAQMSTRPEGLDDAVGHLVAAGDAAEDVDEDRAHGLGRC